MKDRNIDSFMYLGGIKMKNDSFQEDSADRINNREKFVILSIYTSQTLIGHGLKSLKLYWIEL